MSSISSSILARLSALPPLMRAIKAYSLTIQRCMLLQYTLSRILSCGEAKSKLDTNQNRTLNRNLLNLKLSSMKNSNFPKQKIMFFQEVCSQLTHTCTSRKFPRKELSASNLSRTKISNHRRAVTTCQSQASLQPALPTHQLCHISQVRSRLPRSPSYHRTFISRSRSKLCRLKHRCKHHHSTLLFSLSAKPPTKQASYSNQRRQSA
jgi:hypothetical protein